MKKNANRKHARLQSLHGAQLAQVAGGASMLTLAGRSEEGTGWYEFFYAAHMAQKYC